MWRRGKKRNEEGQSGGPASKKFARGGDDADDPADGIVVCELSRNRKVSVRSWQGKAVVDIREFYSKDGKEMPGKKGISLPMDQWKILRDHLDEINEAVAENA